MYADTVKQFSSILPSVLLPPRHSWSVSGSFLTHEAIVPILGSKLGNIRRLCSKLEEVDPHHAFTSLRNCLSIPKLVYILRTCPTFVELMILLEFMLLFRPFPMSLCPKKAGSKYLFQIVSVVYVLDQREPYHCHASFLPHMHPRVSFGSFFHLFPTLSRLMIFRGVIVTSFQLGNRGRNNAVLRR